MFYKQGITALLLLWSPIIFAEDFSAYFLIDSFSNSEPIAIKAVTDDTWDGSFHTGDTAFAVGRAEVGVGWDQWRFGFYRRYDYYYKFSPDTAYLKYYTENKLQLNTGEQLDIYLAANTLIANGVSLTHSLTLADANFDIKVSYLEGKYLTSGSLVGDAEVLAENDYDLEFYVDYFYSEDKLFDREVVSPEGKGYSVDLNIDWSPSDDWDFNLSINDLLAKIFWEDAPRTSAIGDTDTKEYDENGYVIFNPVISGLETYEDYTQTLPRKISFTSAYSLNKASILFEFKDFDIKQFYSIGLGFKGSNDDSVNVFYNYTASALKFYYQSQWVEFGITTDEFQLHKARTFALQLSVTATF